MSGNLTITKTALVSLFDALGYFPNPDDGEPHGPGGPVIRDPFRGVFHETGPSAWRRLLWVLLNPQPLPPKSGPRPEPWRAALLARAVIDESVALGRSAEIAFSEEHGGKIIAAARASIGEFLDEYCGTVPPRHWPRPWPWPLGSEITGSPVELLAAGAQFQKAAATSANSPLAGDFARAADVLFETGMKRLAEGGTSVNAGQSAAV